MWEVEDALDELAQLASTAGAVVCHTVIQKRRQYDPAYLIGRGKVEELAQLCRAQGIAVVIMDEDLHPAQVRNLERALATKVVDRTGLILDIFARRAKTREGKLQVELAQLHYLRSRLVGKGGELSQLGGGIGTRGPGETKLEVDRRRIRTRIRWLEASLETVRRTRVLHRLAREPRRLMSAVLVGYTNAGKSTLFNRLTEASSVVQGTLFSTLDPVARCATLPNRRPLLLIDTVGFIRKLPHQLVAAFHATLEEIGTADLLIHVIDASHPRVLEQIRAVEKVLGELDVLGKPLLPVYNKLDGLTCARGEPEIGPRLYGSRPGVAVSALTGQGLSVLLERLARMVTPPIEQRELFLPYDRCDVVSWLYRQGCVVNRADGEEGILLEVQADPAVLEAVAGFLLPSAH